jgi:hypothetical protein
MIGLMTLWFGPFVDMPHDYGYFYLCPSCYQVFVQPHMDQLQGRLAELHPLAQQLGLNNHDHAAREAEDEDEAEAEDVDMADSGDAVVAGGGAGSVEDGEPQHAGRQSS